MRRFVPALLLSLAAFAFAQQSATLSGIIMTEEPLPDNARVGVVVIDNDNAWRQQVASAAPVAGTFSIRAEAAPNTDLLQPFRGGAVPLPGLQTEYSVTPEGVRFARALTPVYLDNDGNDSFDRLQDTPYLGVPSLDDPVGFFTLIYVDQDATLSGRGTELQLAQGWNIFTVRFPEGGDPAYAASQDVDDAILDVFVP